MNFILFTKLDPSIAYGKCPRLKALPDEMLLLARQAGLSEALVSHPL